MDKYAMLIFDENLETTFTISYMGYEFEVSLQKQKDNRYLLSVTTDYNGFIVRSSVFASEPMKELYVVLKEAIHIIMSIRKNPKEYGGK